ncbi:hypothetical protein [Nostoc sp.]|uniref:hypothetical protein n=1 Tax=Nostoc sp. TaxID=1180 RepID=UPI002FFB800A
MMGYTPPRAIARSVPIPQNSGLMNVGYYTRVVRKVRFNRRNVRQIKVCDYCQW